jgi:hypothetical protein
MTLSSNLYVTGLAEMDYMEMNEKVHEPKETDLISN